MPGLQIIHFKNRGPGWLSVTLHVYILLFAKPRTDFTHLNKYVVDIKILEMMIGIYFVEFIFFI